MLGNVTVLRIWGKDENKNKTLYYIGYCHLQHPGLPVGTKVKEGETIGLVGNTGSASTGSHCHITVSKHLKGVFGATAVKEDLIAFTKRNK